MISNCCFDMHFLMISDVKHLYMSLLDFCTSSLEKCEFSSSVHYLSKLVCILLLIYMYLYIFWIFTPYSLYGLQNFCSIILPFHFIDCLFGCVEVFLAYLTYMHSIS